jgi:hypothetical protein
MTPDADDADVMEPTRDGTTAELRQMLDRQAISDLLHEYCTCADINDPDGIAACFTPDCVADYGPGVGPPSRGTASRRREAARDLALFSATSHHLSNIVIRFEGDDRASASSALMAWHRPAAGGDDWTLWARYEDIVVRTADGWRIQERRMTVAGAHGFPSDWAWLPIGRLPSQA